MTSHGHIVVALAIALIGASIAGAGAQSRPGDGGTTTQPAAPQPAPAIPQPVTPQPLTQASGEPPVGVARTIGPGTPAIHDLSPWSMFLGADVVVKGVMIGLAFASLLTWTVLIAKSLELALAGRRIRLALGRLRRCHSLPDAEAAFPPGRRDVVAALVREAADEAALSAGIEAAGGIRDRAAQRATEAIRAEARRLRVGTGLLATIGSTSPFVGLFGTVWGIMNSFVGISKAQTTNLAVVAPGIAEALLATAIGLVAAIPAVIVYNHFARTTKNHLELVNRASGVVLRLLSRDLDRRRDPGLFRAAAE